jgi:hypothetical protein
MPDAPSKIRWLEAPEAGNYPAALSYLSLVYESKRAKALVKQLSEGKTVAFKAKDIFRASGLSLLGVSNFHVQRDLKKIRSGKALSPILLVRVPEIAKVIVADGYHRMCAVYSLDEDAVMPCRIA